MVRRNSTKCNGTFGSNEASVLSIDRSESLVTI